MTALLILCCLIPYWIVPAEEVFDGNFNAEKYAATITAGELRAYVATLDFR
jgi:hypothetical protein